jgi:hypothetical protein
MTTIEGEIEALGKLSPPAGEEEEVEASIAALQFAFAEAQEERQFGEPSRLVKAYGLSACVTWSGVAASSQSPISARADPRAWS